MEFLKLNINSTKPFYTDKDGKIYNQFYKELKLSQINGSAYLHYVLNDGNGTKLATPISRLIYNTHYPDEDLTGHVIYRKNLDIENSHKISNLNKVSVSKKPVKNKMAGIRKRFYEKLNDESFNVLINLAKDISVTQTTISKLYNVNLQTVGKYRKFLAEQKLKKI